MLIQREKHFLDAHALWVYRYIELDAEKVGQVDLEDRSHTEEICLFELSPSPKFDNQKELEVEEVVVEGPSVNVFVE